MSKSCPGSCGLVLGGVGLCTELARCMHTLAQYSGDPERHGKLHREH